MENKQKEEIFDNSLAYHDDDYLSCTIWNDEVVTTIAGIAEFYAEGDMTVVKKIKPFIRTGLKKV